MNTLKLDNFYIYIYLFIRNLSNGNSLKKSKNSPHPLSLLSSQLKESKIEDHKEVSSNENEISPRKPSENLEPMDDPLMNIASEEPLLGGKKCSAELKKKPLKKLGIIPEKEPRNSNPTSNPRL
jgi:hypothetical protein